MQQLKVAKDISQVCPDEISDLRRALLLSERQRTRRRGRRRLEKIATRGDVLLAPIALAGLASSAFWGGDLRSTLLWAQRVVGQYPMTPAAVWASSLLISVYRTLGMRKEKFLAEQERFRMMRKIAFHSHSTTDRIYALHALKQELEDRDLEADAELCGKELLSLIISLEVPAATPTA
jgi:hypothetical protein